MWHYVPSFGILLTMMVRSNDVKKRVHHGAILWALVFVSIVFVPIVEGGTVARSVDLDTALRSAFGNRQGAAVVVRVLDAQVLAAHNIPTLTHRLATPGSSIKPFTLHLLLDKRLLKASERIACRRNLTISGKRLNCSHAEGLGPFNAEEALAFSCNSYFTEAAKRLQPGDLERLFRDFGFDRTTGLMADEGEGRLIAANTIQQRELMAIGVAGIEITPLGLAMAYTRLARWQKSPTASQRTVLDGLGSATDYGLAQGARPKSLKIAGKTGTASNPGSAGTHAWFAGFAPADHPEIVVVVYLEQGRGSVEAASIARQIFESWETKAR